MPTIFIINLTELYEQSIFIIFRFHKLLKNEPYVHVHISNLAAQTGVTRFTQIHNHWKYSKNESLSDEQLQKFTHLLIEAKSKYSSNLKSFTQTHNILDSIESFSQISVTYKLMPPIKIKTKPAIFILERKNFREDPYGSYFQKNELSQEDISGEDQSGDINKDQNEKDNANVSEEIAEVNFKNTQIEAEEDIYKSEEIIVKPTISEASEQLVTVVNDEDDAIMEKLGEQEPVKTVKIKKIEESPVISRHERKKKAMAKIKSETRKEVVASAKEKLKEIMKRHKHIAVELSENNILDTFKEQSDVDGRGDIPESLEQVVHPVEEPTLAEAEPINTESPENVTEKSEVINNMNVNIESIVEEVIVRLQERKIYDDKTKPEDIKVEDRIVIQKIVEEILSEKMNYKKVDNKTD